LANEVGNALDNPTKHAYAFTTTSPDGQEMPLPTASSPSSLNHDAYGPRSSFSGPTNTLAPQEVLSLPSPHSGMGSRHNSFSGQSDSVMLAETLPGDGTTNHVSINELPTFDAMPDVSHSTIQPPFTFGVAEIHQKFIDSMKSQDERESASEHGPVGGGRLEMLLGEMVDDGEGDGVFGGVSSMGVIGGPSFGIGMGGNPIPGMMQGHEFNAIGVNGW